MQEIIIFQIAIILMSVIIHEISHGYVAELLGDPTARLAGRLTLNPIKHIDPIGTIVVPIITAIAAPFAFGWAKPVPYNPYNLKNGKWGPGLVAGAGPLINVLIAIFFGILIRFSIFSTGAIQIVVIIVFVNIILAFINLMPIPPLDGSKVVSSFLPYNLYRHWVKFEGLVSQYGLLFLFIFFLIFWKVLLPFISYITLFAVHYITGIDILNIIQMITIT